MYIAYALLKLFAVVGVVYCTIIKFFSFFQYLFVDTRHKLIFNTRDDCSTFIMVAVPFTPDEIIFHPTSSDVVLAHDHTTSKVIIIINLYNIFIPPPPDHYHAIIVMTVAIVKFQEISIPPPQEVNGNSKWEGGG